MKQLTWFLILTVTVLTLVTCDKEKTVTSTEYIHDIKYVEGPVDTILVVDTLTRVDTVYRQDSTIVQNTDTIILVDTLVVSQTDTVLVIDTVIQQITIHDTVHSVDTVTTAECLPYVHFAFASMPYYLDQQVIAFINAEFGYSDGWVLYLSLSQSDVSSPATGVYDFYGFIDYWTPDWSSFYPLEYYYRMTHLGGDPSDPDNWQLSEPPATSPSRPNGLALSAARPDAPDSR